MRLTILCHPNPRLLLTYEKEVLMDHGCEYKKRFQGLPRSQEGSRSASRYSGAKTPLINDN